MRQQMHLSENPTNKMHFKESSSHVTVEIHFKIVSGNEFRCWKTSFRINTQKKQNLRGKLKELYMIRDAMRIQSKDDPNDDSTSIIAATIEGKEIHGSLENYRHGKSPNYDYQEDFRLLAQNSH
jgi:hypothetical protein